MAQEYVDPYLVDGRKFDFRVYFLIASADPVTVFFNYGNLRLALQKYGSKSRAAHLTNYHQQLLAGGAGSGCAVVPRALPRFCVVCRRGRCAAATMPQSLQ